MVTLEFRHAAFTYHDAPVLTDISTSFRSGQLAAIIGPNGAGKSTLLGICSGLRTSYEGSCLYQGKEIRQWERRLLAREVAFVPQSLTVQFPFTAEQVVLMGRAPFGDGLFETEEDLAAAGRAMALTDSLAFRHRDFRALSGGERQRVILAAALAQSPKVLLLDEPTTFLDLKHQLLIYGLLAELRSQGLLVLTVTHDLNLAAAYADHVVVLHNGRLHSSGPAAEILTAKTIQEVFEVQCSVLPQPGGSGWIAYGR